MANIYNLPGLILLGIILTCLGCLIGWLIWGKYKKLTIKQEKEIAKLTRLSLQNEEQIQSMDSKMDTYKNKIGDMEETLEKQQQKRKNKED